jgi:ubiquinone/menaquinone biosynthesis C-methylase UbiE
MVEYDWTEDLCRSYAEGIRPIVKYDHRRWAARIAAELTNLPPGATVMDIATGPGFLLLELAQRLNQPQLLAQDGAAPMLAIAREEAARAGVAITTLECPAERLARDDGSVDVVTCKQLLHEAGQVKQTLAECYRVLKPGGRAFLIDFDAEGSWLAPRLLWAFLRLTRGREMAADFWKSYCAGLPGSQVRKQLLDAGFNRVDYVKAGPNYLMQAYKAG